MSFVSVAPDGVERAVTSLMFSALTLHLGIICSGNNDALQCKRYLTDFYRSKEIEFTVPPGAFSFTPPRARRGNQTLDIPTKNGPSLSPSDAHTGNNLGNNVRQRRFSTALLFPGRVDGTSSPLLLSPSILLHCSAPSSPIPNYSPSPSHSPCLSPLPSVHNGKAFVFIYFKFFWLIGPHPKVLISFFKCSRYMFDSFSTSSGKEVQVQRDHVHHHLRRKCHLRLPRAAILPFCQVNAATE